MMLTKRFPVNLRLQIQHPAAVAPKNSPYPHEYFKKKGRFPLIVFLQEALLNTLLTYKREVD